MAWIESHDELPTHPKTAKAARRLGISKPAVVGHLHFLWWWCLTHRPDGRLDGMDAEDVADAAGWADDPDVFVGALVGAGWLDDHDGMLSVHDWWDGAGKTVARRKFATERQRKARKDNEGSRDSGGSHTDVTRDTRVTHAEVTPKSQASHGADSDSDSDSDRSSSTKAQTSSSRKRSDRATRLPEGWTPQPEPELVAAIGGDVAARRELARFRDYWIAQPGQKGRKVDWQATWRNWLRRNADGRPDVEARRRMLGNGGAPVETAAR